MYEEARYEYTVRSCSYDDSQELEEMLNDMASDGWELYSLNEAENDEGEFQYLCIFSRQANGIFETEDDYIVDAGSFKTTMERLINKKEDLYKECRYLQKQIKDKNLQISKIKDSLDSGEDIDREGLNTEISEKMGELKKLKSKFSELISPSSMYKRINQDLLTIEVSYELAELIDNEKDGDLIAESVKLRQKLTDELGYVIPGIHFTISDEMCENEYRIKVRNLEVLRGVVYPGYKRFFPGQSNLDNIPDVAIEDVDIVNDRQVFWIEESATKDFWDNGLSPSQVITSHIEFIVCKYVNDILSYKDVLNYIDLLEDGAAMLTADLLQTKLSIGDLRYIFAGLIREKVSVKDVVYIFEKLNDIARNEIKNNDELLAKLRVSLKRQICSSLADDNNAISVIAIPDRLKRNLLCNLKNNKTRKLQGLIDHVTGLYRSEQTDVLLAEPEYRKQLFDLFEDVIPGLYVISESELSKEFTIDES